MGLRRGVPLEPRLPKSGRQLLADQAALLGKPVSAPPLSNLQKRRRKKAASSAAAASASAAQARLDAQNNLSSLKQQQQQQQQQHNNNNNNKLAKFKKNLAPLSEVSPDGGGDNPLQWADRAVSYEQALEHQCAVLKERLDAERKKLAVLEVRNREAEADVEASRRSMPVVSAIRENDRAADRHVTNLEKRIELAYVRWSKASSHNKKLRAAINDLRARRIKTHEQNVALEKDLYSQKRLVAEISGRARLASEERFNADLAMRELRAQGERDRLAFEREWRDLGKQIEDDRRKADAISRETQALERKDKEKKVVVALPRRRGDNWKTAMDKANTRVSKEHMRIYMEAFAELRATAGVESTSELVDAFIETESETMRLMQHSTELFRDANRIDKSIDALKQKMAKYENDASDAESTRQRALYEFEDRRAKAETTVAAQKTKMAGVDATLSTLLNTVRPLSDKLNCAEIVGTDEVKEDRILAFLGAIEQRTFEMLQDVMVDEKLQVESTSKTVQDAKWRKIKHGRKLCIVPPSTNARTGNVDMEIEANIDGGGVLKTADLRHIARTESMRRDHNAHEEEQ